MSRPPVARRRAGKRRAPRSRGRLRWLLRLMLLPLAIAIAATVLPVLAMRWIPPLTSSFMLAQWFGGGEVHYDWTAWRAIAPEAGLAVIAAEDQRFLEHGGFDLAAVRDAVADKLRGERLRGASTLSQQVAKNLFLWSERSFARKGLEVWFTLWIETLWPKRRILEVYLNVAQMGEGIYGVEAASARYFGKSAARLSAGEAALLAAVLPNPVRLRVANPSDHVRGRQRWILGQMRSLGGREFLAGL